MFVAEKVLLLLVISLTAYTHPMSTNTCRTLFGRTQSHDALGPNAQIFTSVRQSQRLGWLTAILITFRSFSGHAFVGHALIVRARPEQNGRHFASGIFRCIFVKQYLSIHTFWLKFHWNPYGSNLHSGRRPTGAKRPSAGCPECICNRPRPWRRPCVSDWGCGAVILLSRGEFGREKNKICYQRGCVWTFCYMPNLWYNIVILQHIFILRNNRCERSYFVFNLGSFARNREWETQVCVFGVFFLNIC